jgi:hypothetical protein
VGSTFLSLVAGEIGVPYVYGGDSPSGFDCSGLVQWAAGKMGIDLPRGATDQMHALPHVTDPKAGDLVFFNTGDGWEAGHVGICAVDGCAEMVDAPHTGALVRRENVAGFGQIVAYGRLPKGAGQRDVNSDAADSGVGLSLPGVGDVTGLVTDPLELVGEALAALPATFLKVLFGDHTIQELALRLVEIVGGGLILAAGAVSFVIVIAEGGGEPARAARGVRRSTRVIERRTAPVRRAVTPSSRPTREGAPGRPQGRQNALRRSELQSGAIARKAGRAAP